MKNKTVQILEFGTCLPFLVEFISENLRDRGNPSKYHHKLSTQSSQIKKMLSGAYNPSPGFLFDF